MSTAAPLSLDPSLRALLEPIGCWRPYDDESTKHAKRSLGLATCPPPAVLLQKAGLLLSMMERRPSSHTTPVSALGSPLVPKPATSAEHAFIQVTRDLVDEEYDEVIGQGRLRCDFLPTGKNIGSSSWSVLGFFDVAPVKHEVGMDAYMAPDGQPDLVECGTRFPLVWEITDRVHCEAGYMAMSSYGGVAIIGCQFGEVTLFLAPGSNPTRVPLLDQYGNAHVMQSGVGLHGLQRAADILRDAIR
jgi:hypothetical protein